MQPQRIRVGTIRAVSGDTITVHRGRLDFVEADADHVIVAGDNLVLEITTRLELQPLQAVRLAAMLLAPQEPNGDDQLARERE
jgi:hypothetical protein